MDDIKKDEVKEIKKEAPKQIFKIKDFKSRKLDAINSMSDDYKSKKAYDRIMRVGKGRK